MGQSVFDEKDPYSDVTQIVAATGTGLLAITSNAGRRKRADTIIVSSNDTIPHDFQLWLDNGGGQQTLLGTVTIPIGAGNDGATPPVDVFAALPGLSLGIAPEDGYSLKISVTVAVAGAFIVYVSTLGGYL